MNKIIGYIILVCLSFQVNAQKREVKLKFEETGSYCGGAAPTEEMIQELKKKKPFANQTVYVYEKDKCIDSLKTDSVGEISKKLRYGSYTLLLPWKHFKTVPNGELNDYDPICLKKEWQRADATLKVSAKEVIFNNSRIGHQFCSWQYNCLKHRHIPPSAAKQN